MNGKLTVDMTSWMLTGDFSGIFPGETKRQVAQKLGQPSGWGSTETKDEVESMDADLWGYGVWTMYFEGDVLDAITCSIYGAEEHGFYFDVERNFFSVHDNMSSVEKILTQEKIHFARLGSRYSIKKHSTGEVIDCRRRLNLPAILLGSDLRTRITFENESGRIRGIGSPFSLRRQVLSQRKADPVGAYSLLGD